MNDIVKEAFDKLICDLVSNYRSQDELEQNIILAAKMIYARDNNLPFYVEKPEDAIDVHLTHSPIKKKQTAASAAKLAQSLRAKHGELGAFERD